MSMFGNIDASASGMTAERLRMDVISNNLANANTTRTAMSFFSQEIIMTRLF